MLVLFEEHRSRRNLVLNIIAITALALPHVARATDHHWNASSGNWGAASNWSPQSVPGASDVTYVDFFNGSPGSVSVPQAEPSVVSVTIMNSNIVGISGNAINSGSLGMAGDMIVGSQGTHGTLSVINGMPGINPYFGNVTVGNTMRIGMFSGVGTVNQNDGTVNVNQLLRIADSNAAEFPAAGTYNLSGGVVNAARLDVGYGGDTNPYTNMNGSFNLSGGVLNVGAGAQAHDLMLGGGGSNGFFRQTGGTLNLPFRVIDFARGGGQGNYFYSGGTFNVQGVVFSGASGALNYINGASLSVGQLQMLGGGQVLLFDNATRKTLNTTVLWVTSNNAIIELNSNDMTVGSTVTTLGGQSLRTLLTRGYNNGSWDGNGIRSFAASTDFNHRTALGYDNSSPINVRYTYYGDANLDRKVDLTDFTFLAANFNGTGKNWWQADFNYDGSVNLTDFTFLASNFNATLPAPSAASGEGAVVPEPVGTTMSFLVISAMSSRPRRRPMSQIAAAG
jgi:hypothetical protein